MLIVLPNGIELHIDHPFEFEICARVTEYLESLMPTTEDATADEVEQDDD